MNEKNPENMYKISDKRSLDEILEKNEDPGFKEISDSILSYVTGHHPGYLGPTDFPVSFKPETEEDRRKRLKLFKKAVDGIHELDKNLYSALEEYSKAGNNTAEINKALNKLKEYSKNATDYFPNLMSNIEGLTDDKNHKNYLKTKWGDIFNKTINSNDDVKKALNLHNFFVTIRKALETAEYVEQQLENYKNKREESYLENAAEKMRGLRREADFDDYKRAYSSK